MIYSSDRAKLEGAIEYGAPDRADVIKSMLRPLVALRPEFPDPEPKLVNLLGLLFGGKPPRTVQPSQTPAARN